MCNLYARAQLFDIKINIKQPVSYLFHKAMLKKKEQNNKEIIYQLIQYSTPLNACNIAKLI